MRELDNDPAIAQTVELMNSYGLDLHGYTILEIITQLLERYHANWIRLATIEALYLGRYKVISVEQILRVWSRVGTPNPHFGHEFERLICRKLPRHSTYLPENTSVNSAKAEKTTTADREQIIESELSSTDDAPKSTETDIIEATSESSDFEVGDGQRPQQTERSRSRPEQPSIHQFTPLPDVSSFYNKLKSLAEEKSKED